MISYCVKLAGEIINIENMYDYTMKLCKDYIVDSECIDAKKSNASRRLIQVRTCKADLEIERVAALEACEREGRSTSHITDPYLESLATYRKICKELASSGTVLMHGSAIAVCNDRPDAKGVLSCGNSSQAIIFIAESGTGKSTHVQQWVKRYGLVGDGVADVDSVADRPGIVEIINDDKPLISTKNACMGSTCNEDGPVVIHGTPWDGKHRRSSNISAPLKAVCILDRGKENRIRRVSSEEAIPALLQQTYCDEDSAMMIQVLAALDVIANNCEFYVLECLPNEEAAELVYESVFGDGIEVSPVIGEIDCVDTGCCEDDSEFFTYEEILDNEGVLIYKNKGESMMPLIRQGLDLLKIKKYDAAISGETGAGASGNADEIKKYDVILFKRDGKYILHRVIDIIRVYKLVVKYVVRGDNQWRPEIVMPEQIIGVLEAVVRDGVELDPCEPEYIEKYVRHYKRKFVRECFARAKAKLK